MLITNMIYRRASLNTQQSNLEVDGLQQQKTTHSLLREGRQEG